MLKRLFAAVTCSALVLVAGTTTADAAFNYSSPQSVRVETATPGSVSLAWSAVPSAPTYQVQIATNRAMRGSRLQPFQGSRGTVTGLTAGKRYFFRVAVFGSPRGARLSPFSARSATRVPMAPAPSGLRTAAVSTTSTTLAWQAIGVPAYRVRLATTPDMNRGVQYRRSTSPTATFASLAPGSTYYVKVRGITGGGRILTAFTDAIRVSTPTGTTTPPKSPPPPAPTPKPSPGPGSAGTAADINVASFNVLSTTFDSKASATSVRRPWKERRQAVVDTIMRETPDVLGVQEAHFKLGLQSHLVDGPTQFQDLEKGLTQAGGHYAVNSEALFNCANQTSNYRCQYQQRGAGGWSRIFYNTDRLTMLSTGSYAYSRQWPGSSDRYLVWATFRLKSTGKQFIFFDTHLDPHSKTVRDAQWLEMISQINQLKGSLPIVAVGDLNMTKNDPSAAKYLPLMKAQGYGDVTGQQYNTNPTPNPRPLSTINQWLGSYNGFHQNVAAYGNEINRTKNGNNLDWIFATNAMTVKQWEVVVNYNPATLQTIGTIPSDHNMVRATLTLP